jgi:uncharacterized cofD-like protein
MDSKKVVIIGGGTGTYTVLTGLKKFPVELSVIVTMMDSGGSNRVIRDELGLLPTSDIRQCIVALASDESSEILRNLFTYRYANGVGISGMTFGNLFMAALSDIYSSQKEALDKTCEMLDVKGKIIPVTYEKTNLVARYENGKQILGEHEIDEPDEELGEFKIVELEVFPKVKANPDAVKAIKNADMVILGPGDFYTSILCNIVVPGIAKALNETKAKVVYVGNLMTKFGQTNDFKASDFIEELEMYLGKGTVDFILVNSTKRYPPGVLKRYKEERAQPVVDDLGKMNKTVKVVRADLVSDTIYSKAAGDSLKRSLIRHDSDKLAKTIMSLLS